MGETEAVEAEWRRDRQHGETGDRKKEDEPVRNFVL